MLAVVVFERRPGLTIIARTSGTVTFQVSGYVTVPGFTNAVFLINALASQ
jgi:filamentous hemagglutinin family protein